MTILSVFLYDTFIKIYAFGIQVVSIWNHKARLWLIGRKNLLEKIENDFKSFSPQTERIWMHCASLGEFEQGRTFLEILRKQKPEAKIVLTFFSPSGYEVRKNYKQADFIYYIPVDTRKNAKRFLELVRPSIIIFVKYEFWYHYFSEAGKYASKFILIAGIFRKSQVFFKWYGGLYRKMLASLSHIFVQDEISFGLLNKLKFNNITIAGDTRIDRVADIADLNTGLPEIENFLAGKKAFIGGSIYNTENELIYRAYQEKQISGKVILAPHLVDIDHIRKISDTWGNNAILYSKLNQDTIPDHDVLIIDSIGLLSYLYKYGYIALIGGGFGKGIHNILEPAAFGIPVIFGPKYEKFKEALDMLSMGAAFSFKDFPELILILKHLKSPESLKNSGIKAQSYISTNKGGTEKILLWLESNQQSYF